MNVFNRGDALTIGMCTMTIGIFRFTIEKTAPGFKLP